jgi:hypothetical protein
MSWKKLCVKLVTHQNYTKMHGPKKYSKIESIWLVNDQDGASDQNFSLGCEGGGDPEAIYNLFYFQNHFIQIM